MSFTQASKFVTTKAVIIIYKVFVKHHMDYGDVLYDQAFNIFFREKLEFAQNNAITGLITGSSKKLCQELGLKPLHLCCWYIKLFLFYKILKIKHTQSFFNSISTSTKLYNSLQSYSRLKSFMGTQTEAEFSRNG